MKKMEGEEKRRISACKEETLLNDEMNWLHEEHIACPSCHLQLFRVDHSPFYDEHFLYCDHCPIRVEVSFYDPVYKQITQTLARKEGESYKVLMQALEAHIKSCRCGGTFRHDAPRRCFACHSPVIVDTPAGVDLWDGSFSAETLTEKEEENARHWTAQFIRTEDIWRDDER